MTLSVQVGNCHTSWLCTSSFFKAVSTVFILFYSHSHPESLSSVDQKIPQDINVIDGALGSS